RPVLLIILPLRIAAFGTALNLSAAPLGAASGSQSERPGPRKDLGPPLGCAAITEGITKGEKSALKVRASPRTQLAAAQGITKKRAPPCEAAMKPIRAFCLNGASVIRASITGGAT